MGHDTLVLPVPFQYFHVLNLMITVNLSFWAYGMALTDSWFAPMIFVCAEAMYLGLLSLSSQLSNPFGEDEVDFPLGQWVSEYLDTTVTLVEHDHHLQTGMPLEEKV